MSRRLEQSRYVVPVLVVLSLCGAALVIRNNTELAALGIFGYLLKLIVVGWFVLMVLSAICQLIDYVCERTGLYRGLECIGVLKPDIGTVEQVDQMSPQEWFALNYDQRIETVKLFLQREYPDDYSHYVPPVFVLIEDATASQLRRWEAEGAEPARPVSSAMFIAVLDVGHRAKSEGYVEGVMRAADLFKKKQG